VPIPRELTELLHGHMATFGTGPDGRLFTGERSEELPKLTYMRAWRAARRIASVPEIAAGPLTATPYALRHACVPTWLNGGVPAPQVAERAGHSSTRCPTWTRSASTDRTSSRGGASCRRSGTLTLPRTATALGQVGGRWPRRR
jgi:integrase